MKLSEYIQETLLNSVNLNKVIKEFEDIGFVLVDRTEKNSLDKQSAYFGFNDISLFDKITMKIKLYNYYLSGGWTNGVDTKVDAFTDYKYVIKISPNITNNVFDYIKKENYICWHLTTKENYKRILNKGYLKVKSNDSVTNKFERLYIFPSKKLMNDFKSKSSLRAMYFSLTSNRGISHNILFRIDLSKTNIDKVEIDPDAPGFNAVYVFEPISLEAVTDIYELEFPKSKDIFRIKEKLK